MGIATRFAMTWGVLDGDGGIDGAVPWDDLSLSPDRKSPARQQQDAGHVVCETPSSKLGREKGKVENLRKPILRYAKDLAIYLAVNLDTRKRVSLGRCRAADKFKMDCSRGKEVVKRRSRAEYGGSERPTVQSHLIALFKKVH
jgi:hypothetical protein